MENHHFKFINKQVLTREIWIFAMFNIWLRKIATHFVAYWLPCHFISFLYFHFPFSFLGTRKDKSASWICAHTMWLVLHPISCTWSLATWRVPPPRSALPHSSSPPPRSTGFVPGPLQGCQRAWNAILLCSIQPLAVSILLVSPLFWSKGLSLHIQVYSSFGVNLTCMPNYHGKSA